MASETFILKSKDRDLLSFVYEPVQTEIGGSVFTEYRIRIKDILEVQEQAFPFSLRGLDGKSLHDWIATRVSPVGKRVLEALQKASRDDDLLYMARQTMLLSLNDAYWIDSQEHPHKWSDINLYSNTFNEAIGELVFSTGFRDASLQKIRQFAMRSPEFTSKGQMKKCWVRRENGLFLIKEDTFKTGYNQACAEWFAQQVAQAMGIEHLHYDLEYYRHREAKRRVIIASCKIFTSEDTGFVEAHRLYPDIDPRTQLGQAKLKMAFGDIFYGDMMIFDVLVANHDRHTANFGFLYETNTGELVRPAPIFDHGFSLLSMEPFSRKFDFDEFRRRRSCAFFSFERQLDMFLEKRHLPMIEKIRHMEFEQHPKVAMPDRVIERLTGFIHSQAQFALDRSVKACL